MFRGQTYDIEFWGQTMLDDPNKTLLPVDFYIMNADQFRAFLEHNSADAIVHVESNHTSVHYVNEQHGQYYVVFNMTGPTGAKRVVGYSFVKHGLNYTFYEPFQFILGFTIIDLSYITYKWLKVRK